ncbi:hypothetical protein GCM10020000_07470 [Streptomyces olivoverticillatus]
MVDHVSGELPTTEPLTGDWRTDLKAIAHLQRALMLRHPWLPAALSARRSLGPNTLAFLERALGALRPTRLDGVAKLDVFSMLTGLVSGHVTYEITQAAAADSPDRAAAEARYLAAVIADGRHPELAEVLAAPGRPLTPRRHFRPLPRPPGRRPRHRLIAGVAHISGDSRNGLNGRSKRFAACSEGVGRRSARPQPLGVTDEDHEVRNAVSGSGAGDDRDSGIRLHGRTRTPAARPRDGRAHRHADEPR